MPAGKRITIGRVTRPHGLGGYLEVMSLTDNPDRFQVGNSFHLSPPWPERETVTISGIKHKKRRYLLLFEDCENMDSAAPLIGRELTVSEDDATKPAGAFWIHEIVGMDVVTTDGASLGKVNEVLRTGGNDVYVVDGAKKYYIPAIKDVIKRVDTEQRVIEIDPLPGLLDL